MSYENLEAGQKLRQAAALQSASRKTTEVIDSRGKHSNKLTPLYHPVEGKPMHVVVFGSGSGTNLEAIIQAQKKMQKECGHSPFEVKAVFSDRICRFQEVARAYGISTLYCSFVRFFESRETRDYRDHAMRCEYDQEVIKVTEEASLEEGWSVDTLLLGGYMRLLYPPFLERFRNKILNVHPADLSVVDAAGLRRYVGVDAVRQALSNGETRTCSSVILVDEGVDSGPVLITGPWVDYVGKFPVVEEDVKLHQEKQKALSDWPACVFALSLIAQGRIAVDDKKRVFIDGVLQPSCGHRLGHEKEAKVS